MSGLSAAAWCAVSYAVSLIMISVVGKCVLTEIIISQHAAFCGTSAIAHNPGFIRIRIVYLFRELAYSAVKPFFSVFGIPVRWGTGARGNGGAGLYIAGRYSFLN